MRIKWKQLILAILALIVVIVGILFIIPSTRESIIWHISDIAAQIRLLINPPSKVGFNPVETTAIDLQATLTANAPVTQLTEKQLSTQSTTEPTVIPTTTPTPLPGSVNITTGKYFSQHNYFNYCAPANLAMELSYWGWNGKLTDVGSAIKPFAEDKNVMPYEMLNYAWSINFAGIIRVGGDIDVLKRFTSAGFPVLVETGVFFNDLNGRLSWMGHYRVVTGYDDSAGELIFQDSFLENGINAHLGYDEFLTQWRSFNYTYILIFPTDRLTEVNQILGSDADENTNFRNAWIKASNEVVSLSERDLFFAWYNVGTNLVGLQDYAGAASAYDTAFSIYNTLPEDLTYRPYRILWYETGPFFAYFNTGRYQYVIDIATNNSIELVTSGPPALEESYYWRGMAENALGQTDKAIDDFKEALYYHVNFTPAVTALQQLGVNP